MHALPRPLGVVELVERAEGVGPEPGLDRLFLRGGEHLARRRTAQLGEPVGGEQPQADLPDRIGRPRRGVVTGMDVELPVQPEVDVEDEIAVERDEEVLAPRGRTAPGPAVEERRPVLEPALG